MQSFLRPIFALLVFAAAVAIQAAQPTNTIPLVTIRTQRNAPIVDKVTPIPATMNIIVPEGYTTLNGKAV